MAPRKPAKGVNQEAAKGLPPAMRPPAKGVNRAAAPAPARGVNQAAAKALPPAMRPVARGVNQAAARGLPRTTKSTSAPAAPPAPASARGAPAGAPPPGQGAPTGTAAPPAVTPAGSPAGSPAAPGAPAAPAVDIEATARNLYGYMSWALDDPELGKVLRQAAAEGWDPARLKGAVFATNWFKTHGTHKVATAIKEYADAYLVPMDDQSRRNWAFKIITGEVQPTEMNQYLREQSKSRFPQLAAAIDRGITVWDYASPYRAVAAQTLELAPEAINLNDPIWRRALDGHVDPKTNERTAMSLADWERTLKTDSVYGWDFTKGARTEAAAFAAKLQETFGAR